MILFIIDGAFSSATSYLSSFDFVSSLLANSSSNNYLSYSAEYGIINPSTFSSMCFLILANHLFFFL